MSFQPSPCISLPSMVGFCHAVAVSVLIRTTTARAAALGDSPSGARCMWGEASARLLTRARLADAGLARRQDYFMRLVDTTVETSVAHVRDFVRRYLEQRLLDARGRIGAYGSRYANAVLTALDTSRCGARCLAAAVPGFGGAGL